METKAGPQPEENEVKISLKARNVPKLLSVWVVNVAIFSGVSSGALDVRDLDAMSALMARMAQNPWAGWPYAALLTLVSVFNGMVSRRVKERLVFWRSPRPGARAFSHFMHRDSTIDRNAIEERFAPLPIEPDEQNALWARWLNEFEDDARVRPAYGLYLFGRDWTTIAAATFIVGCPLALALGEDRTKTLWYGVVIVGQYLLARLLARVQAEQMVMSVMACKGASLGDSRGGRASGKDKET